MLPSVLPRGLGVTFTSLKLLRTSPSSTFTYASVSKRGPGSGGEQDKQLTQTRVILLLILNRYQSWGGPGNLSKTTRQVKINVQFIYKEKIMR